MLLAFNSQAQENYVSVVVSVIPPYSHKVNDYIDNNQILVTLQYIAFNNGNPEIDIYLQGEVSNDGGDRIFTNKNHKPTQPITLSQGVPYTITPDDLEDIFDFDYIETEGINKQNLYTGAGLPEGSYTICVRAYDFNTNKPVSDEEPGGCSAPFEILNMEAPEFFLPECGATITPDATLVDSINNTYLSGQFFSWIMPSGGVKVGQLEYHLKIKAVPTQANINPQDIMNDKSIAVDYDEITEASGIYVDNQKYVFESGNTYIFTVTASDPEGNLVIQNNGESEVCWFNFQEFDSYYGDLIFSETPKDFDSLSLNIHRTLSGKIYYTFPEPDKKAGDDFTPGEIKNPLAGKEVKLKVVYYLEDASSTSSVGHGSTHNYDLLEFKSEGTISFGEKPDFGSQKVTDNYFTIASSTTEQDGSFVFDFDDNIRTGFLGNFVSQQIVPAPYNPQVEHEIDFNLREIGMERINPYEDFLDFYGNNAIDLGNMLYPDAGNNMTTPAEHQWNSQVGNAWQQNNQSQSATQVAAPVEMPMNQGNMNHGPNPDDAMFYSSGNNPKLDKIILQGKLYRKYKVVVEDGHYCSPDDYFDIEFGGSEDAGTLYSLVQTYNLELKAVATNTISNQAASPGMPIPNVECFVLRQWAVPQNIPSEEVNWSGETTSHWATTDDTIAFNNINFKLVGKGESNAEGICVFHNMVRHTPNIQQEEYGLRTQTYERSGQIKYISNSEVLFGAPKSINTSNIGSPYYYKFNQEYEVETHNESIIMYPDYPSIAGRTMYRSSPLSGVECKTNISGKTAYTGITGYFELNNLPIIIKNANLTLSKYGFEEKEIDTLGNLVWGDRPYFADIEMIPWGKIKGYVVDEDGEPVEADVKVDEYELNPTILTKDGHILSETSFQRFMFRAPSGEHRKLTIIPRSSKYIPFDTILKINKRDIVTDNAQHLGKFIVKKQMHRMAFTVKNNMQVPLQNITIKVLDYTVVTNYQGKAEINFYSPENHFDIEFIPSENDVNFIAGKTLTNILNNPSSEAAQINVILDEAVMIFGRVRSDNSMGIAEARVYVEGVNGLETFTNSNGYYELKGVPKNCGQVTVWAVKSEPETTYIGDSKQVTLNSASKSLDFKLGVVNDVDISAIWGFPVEITSIQNDNEGDKWISGALVRLSTTQNLEIVDKSLRLPFSNLELKAGTETNSKGIPIAAPVKSEFNTDKREIELRVFENYNALLKPKNTTWPNLIKVQKSNDNLGFISDQIWIKNSNFPIPAEEFNYNSFEAFYLAKPGTNNSDIIAIQVKKQSGSFSHSYQLLSTKYSLVNHFNGNPSFSSNGFKLICDAEKSYINKDGLHITANIKSPNIKLCNFTDSTLFTSNILLTKNGINEYGNYKSFHFDIEDFDNKRGWRIICPNGWKSHGNYFSSEDAEIETGLVRLPVKQLQIFNNRIAFSGIEQDNLSLSGLLPINVMPGAETLLYYDPEVGKDKGEHYVMKIIAEGLNEPAASIEGVPGLKPHTKVRFGSMTLITSGETLITGFEDLNSADLWFYDVLRFKLQTLDAYEDNFMMGGLFDLGLPNMVARRAMLKFHNDEGEFKVTPVDLMIEVEGKGNVKYRAFRGKTQGDPDAEQILNENGYSATGEITITDQNESKYLYSTLYVRKGKMPYIEIDRPQKIDFGTGNLRIDAGKMEVVNNGWDNLWFEGPIKVDGMKEDDIFRFEVEGGVVANKDEVGFEGCSFLTDAGLGNVSLVYNIKNSEFVGSLEIARPIPIGPVVIAPEGSEPFRLETRFGAQGWFVMGSGTILFPIIGNINAGMAIGMYNDKTIIVQRMQEYYPYGKIESLKGIGKYSGFYLGAYKNDIAGIRIPNLSWNYPPFTLKIGGEVGAGSYLFKTFDNLTKLDFGLSAKAHVYAQMETFFCTSVGGAASVSTTAIGTCDFSNPLLINTKINFCASAGLDFYISQCFGIKGLTGCHKCQSLHASKYYKLGFTVDGVVTPISFFPTGFDGPKIEQGKCE